MICLKRTATTYFMDCSVAVLLLFLCFFSDGGIKLWPYISCKQILHTPYGAMNCIFIPLHAAPWFGTWKTNVQIWVSEDTLVVYICVIYLRYRQLSPGNKSRLSITRYIWCTIDRWMVLSSKLSLGCDMKLLKYNLANCKITLDYILFK